MGKSPSSVFISLALDMSWKLATVVLLPIIGGSLLAHKYKANYYLIAGAFVAFILAIVVVYQSYNIANQSEDNPKDAK